MNDAPMHPILTCAAAKALEAALLPDEAAEWTAMQRAGAAIACAVLGDFREIGGLSERAQILVLAGKGHNGGDALLAATILLETCPAAAADIALPFGEASLRPLARRSLEELRRRAPGRSRIVDLAVLKHEFASYDLCLDGVFGFQFRPPLDESVAELLAWVNTHPRIRLRGAVDLPSGLGEASAKTIFRADFTYATGSVKAPLVQPEHAPFVGRVRYLDLGFFSAPRPPDSATARACVLLPALLKPLAALRPVQSDKRTYGHLFVVGGSRSYPGAVVMTVQAALRSGVGLLTAFVPVSLAPEYAARFPEAMWVGCPETPAGGLASSALALIEERAARASALVLGPGLSAEPECLALAAAVVRNANVPILLDADALRPEVVAAGEGKRVILTPHAGEWQRLGGGAGLRPAEGVAPAHEMIAVLKGSPTRIEAPSRRAENGVTYYSFFGGPVLARGGSGDLLAGLIGGLLAQQPDDLWLAAARGVVWHGLAADLLARDKGQVAVQTTQLLEFLQPALHCAAHDTT